MEKFEPACPWHIQVGDLFIAPGRVPNSGTVWIGEVEGGEGGEFKPPSPNPFLPQRPCPLAPLRSLSGSSWVSSALEGLQGRSR